MTGRPLAASGSRFAIATPHVEATAAGLAAFDAGGNAVDAALAASTTLAVAYPHMCGVGGDLFALVRDPDGRTIVVNASGAAPAAVDPDALRRQHARVPTYGPHSVTVPGAVSGWWRLAFSWSRLGFAPAFERAIGLAGDGLPVARSLAAGLATDTVRLLSDPGIASVFAPEGEPLREGATLVQPALARTLEAIATLGPEALYEGEVGANLVEHLRRLGSPIAAEDLLIHDPELDSPVMGRYRDLDVSVPPPNSQGFVLLQILAGIEHLDIHPDPLGADAPMLANLFRVTAADRNRHNADPRHARVPVGTLVDDGHVAALCDEARDPAVGEPARARGATAAPSHRGDTAGLVAADADGMAVSLVQSLYDGFGSGVLEPATGVILHNRGSAFSLDPSHPNAIAGGKRPAHTLMPVIVHREGRLAAVSGTMGGGAHPQINAIALARLFDIGMSPADAVAAPRWLVGGMSLDVSDRRVVAEGSVPAAVRGSLRAAAYSVDLMDALDEAVGHANLLRADGSFEAGSDPRADGGAAAR